MQSTKNLTVQQQRVLATSDPYVIIKVGPTSVARSASKSATLEPQWNQRFDVIVDTRIARWVSRRIAWEPPQTNSHMLTPRCNGNHHASHTEQIEFKLYDKDLMSGDDYMGHARLLLSELLRAAKGASVTEAVSKACNTCTHTPALRTAIAHCTCYQKSWLPIVCGERHGGELLVRLETSDTAKLARLVPAPVQLRAAAEAADGGGSVAWAADVLDVLADCKLETGEEVCMCVWVRVPLCADFGLTMGGAQVEESANVIALVHVGTLSQEAAGTLFLTSRRLVFIEAGTHTAAAAAAATATGSEKNAHPHGDSSRSVGAGDAGSSGRGVHSVRAAMFSTDCGAPLTFPPQLCLLRLSFPWAAFAASSPSLGATHCSQTTKVLWLCWTLSPTTGITRCSR